MRICKERVRRNFFFGNDGVFHEFVEGLNFNL